MKTITTFLLFTTMIVNSQTEVALKGGYGKGGMLIGAQVEHYIGPLGLNTSYLEYNMTGPDIRQLDLGVGYRLPIGRTVSKIASGMVYQWDNWKTGTDWKPFVSLRFGYELDPNCTLFLEGYNNGTNNYMIGVSIPFKFSKRKKKRFF